MQVAALETVLVQHALGLGSGLPVWTMLREPPAHVRRRADELAMALDGELEGAHVIACESGRRGAPGTGIPSFGVEIGFPSPTRWRPGCARVRRRCSAGSPNAACCSISGRCRPDAIPDLVRAVRYALEGDDLPDD